MKQRDGLISILRRHGIGSAYEVLEKNGDQASVGPSDAPDVRVRGSIHLMKQRKVTRQEVSEGFKRLKYL